jgi:hypothetical protein
MRLHRTAQLAAKNRAASFASLAKPPKKKGYNSLRKSKPESGNWRFYSAPVKRLPLGVNQLINEVICHHHYLLESN